MTWRKKYGIEKKLKSPVGKKETLFIKEAMSNGTERDNVNCFRPYSQTLQLRNGKLPECILPSSFVSYIFRIPRFNLF